MAKVNAILSQRFQIDEKPSKKMEALSKASAAGQLTTFSGIFGSSELSNTEKQQLETLLINYSDGSKDIDVDLKNLIMVTSEVKAINHQAIILHGERIKKAQIILKSYREGAFSAWLLTTYGNRQTPYNFLQYYEFYSLMPTELHQQIEQMPRQAIYALASRDGSSDRKQDIIKNYQGQTKREMLDLIRDVFPLPERDLRRQDIAENAITALTRVAFSLGKPKTKINPNQKKKIEQLLHEIADLL